MKKGALKCAQEQLQNAQNATDRYWNALVGVLKRLGEILSDELGLTDAFNCVTKGDLGACGDTALNILGSLLGGVAARMLARYGLPWKWKEAADLARKIGGLIAEGIGHIKNWLNSFETLKKARAKVASLTKKGDCHSFVPGTQVLMADGTRKPLEQVQIGDQVVATDPISGQTTAQPVIDVITGQGEKNLVQITIDAEGDNDHQTDVIVATDSHPFWAADQGRWFNASSLTPGMQLRTSAGTPAQITFVTSQTVSDQRVHNLSVNADHTYYVAVGWADVLVHNCPAGGADEAEDAAEAAARAAKRADQKFARNNYLDPNSDIVQNREMTVADFIGQFRGGGIKGVMPGEYLNMTVADALRAAKAAKNTRLRKLLTDGRFDKEA
ncbi:hypothetical protein GCM10009555_047460 [Acrocarpospora macrocephala]|uniref:Uncharacterized protein n=1 Tax=Acrocarpospora macrocephala TaxID=150177 RepID=A0A5M3X1A8_9ACTN|nr:polymorphic toxin-type HINT domain-containing protein [Acrocarpospora macrocephala]GES12088.1 hypothetical protein Amac_056850 [Acrocarpospora macrocephala]